MAFRRALSIRATLFARRLNPSFSYIHHDHDHDHTKHQEFHSSRSKIDTYLSQTRSFRTYVNNTPFQFSHQTGYRLPVNYNNGLLLNRYMSTSVAAAASDPGNLVAAAQSLIEGVHSFTGFNWWTSIILTAFLVRGGLGFPFTLFQLHRFKSILCEKWGDEQLQKMQAMIVPQDDVEGCMTKMQRFKEFGVKRFPVLMRLLIEGPLMITFTFAILDMLEKVPSLKTGGPWLCPDLTTPLITPGFLAGDHPVLTVFAFWCLFKCVRGNRDVLQWTSKELGRDTLGLSLLLGLIVPKGLVCFYLPSYAFRFAKSSFLSGTDTRDVPRDEKEAATRVVVQPPSNNLRHAYIRKNAEREVK